MHLRRFSNLFCSCMKRTVQWQQWMQQGKSCSPNDAKPSRTFPTVTHDALRQHTLRAAYQAFVWGQCLHRAPRLPPPSGWTKDEGQPWKPLWTTLRQTRATSWSTVAANKAVKQDASVQLPTSHVLHYATVEETAIKTAFESCSRLCELFNFISTSFLFTLWIYSVLFEHWIAIFWGFH